MYFKDNISLPLYASSNYTCGPHLAIFPSVGAKARTMRLAFLATWCLSQAGRGRRAKPYSYQETRDSKRYARGARMGFRTGGRDLYLKGKELDTSRVSHLRSSSWTFSVARRSLSFAASTAEARSRSARTLASAVAAARACLLSFVRRGKTRTTKYSTFGGSSKYLFPALF